MIASLETSLYEIDDLWVEPGRHAYNPLSWKSKRVQTMHSTSVFKQRVYEYNVQLKISKE